MEDYTTTIKRMIHSTFGRSVKRLSISMTGLLTDIDITYEDNMTITQAREWFNKNIPMLWNLSIERTFSTMAFLSVGMAQPDDWGNTVMAEELLFTKDLRKCERHKRQHKNKKQPHSLTI